MKKKLIALACAAALGIGFAAQAAAEDNAVKNFQANMKKAGKPIPKPTPIAAAAKGAAPAKPADKAPAKKG